MPGYLRRLSRYPIDASEHEHVIGKRPGAGCLFYWRAWIARVMWADSSGSASSWSTRADKASWPVTRASPSRSAVISSGLTV
jgi:hypothetical protein